MFFIGQKVVCIYDFTIERIQWGYNFYPRKGEVLTIQDIEPHHKYKFSLLWFRNMPFGLCDKNFVPLLEEKGECSIEDN